MMRFFLKFSSNNDRSFLFSDAPYFVQLEHVAEHPHKLLQIVTERYIWEK